MTKATVSPLLRVSSRFDYFVILFSLCHCVIDRLVHPSSWTKASLTCRRREKNSPSLTEMTVVARHPSLGQVFSVVLQAFVATATWPSSDMAALTALILAPCSSSPASSLEARRSRFSPLVVWTPSHFTRLRLQYNLDRADSLREEHGGRSHGFWPGIDFMYGVHPAHAF